MKFASKLAALVFVALALPIGADARDWPAREPIRFIVVFPPGGASDVTARLIGARLGEALKQSVIVENRPGAGGVIGAEVVARSAPDGYTMLMANLGPNALAPVVFKKLPYDPIKDFQSVTLTSLVPQVVVVNPDMPVKSISELIAYAKANPGKVRFGSAGHGASNHLSGELLNSMGGIKMHHVPYKGDAPSLAALMGGEIHVALPTLIAGLPHVRAGKLRAIAVTSRTRWDGMPDLPAVAETLPGFEAVSWGGVMVPAGTPKEIVARLNSEINKILKMPDIAEKLRGLGAIVVGSTPEEFDKYVQDEIARWGKVVRDNNIALQ
jgi:tripartite-type tricarboxylate transporter receptor subunit TctC